MDAQQTRGRSYGRWGPPHPCTYCMQQRISASTWAGQLQFALPSCQHPRLCWARELASSEISSRATLPAACRHCGSWRSRRCRAGLAAQVSPSSCGILCRSTKCSQHSARSPTPGSYKNYQWRGDTPCWGRWPSSTTSSQQRVPGPYRSGWGNPCRHTTPHAAHSRSMPHTVQTSWCRTTNGACSASTAGRQPGSSCPPYSRRWRWTVGPCNAAWTCCSQSRGQAALCPMGRMQIVLELGHWSGHRSGQHAARAGRGRTSCTAWRSQRTEWTAKHSFGTSTPSCSSSGAVRSWDTVPETSSSSPGWCRPSTSVSISNSDDDRSSRPCHDESSLHARVFCSTVRIVVTVKSSRKYSIGAELRAGSCWGPGALTVKACGATWSSSSPTRPQPSSRRTGSAAGARPRPPRPRPPRLRAWDTGSGAWKI